MIPISKINSAWSLDPNIIYLCAGYHKCWFRVLDILSTCGVLNKNKYTRMFRVKHILISIIYIFCVIKVTASYRGQITITHAVFESRRGHIWRVFHLWLCFITFGGRSAHLPYQVHKSGCKTPIIIITALCACMSD